MVKLYQLRNVSKCLLFLIKVGIKKSMATSKPWAHHILTCDLCETSTQQFCNSCCRSVYSTFNNCVKKQNDEFYSLSHEIVNFEGRTSQLVFSECNGHPSQRYETQCNNCNSSVCVKCILSGAHKSENVEELIETFERRSQ